MTLPILLFLKAAIKTQIQVPGFYKKDGTYVQPHTRTVLVDPDKDKASVLSGAGSHYQKVAHKLVQQHVQGWHDLNDDDKLAILLAHATDLQQAASDSAAISMWKKAALAGQNPKKAQWAAFHKLLPEKQAKLMALVKEKVGSIGHLAGASHAAQPQVQEPAAVQAAPAEPAAPAPVAKGPAAQWSDLTADKRAQMLTFVSPLYVNAYGKPTAKAKQLAALGWDALTPEVQEKLAPIIEKFAPAVSGQAPSTKGPSEPMPEKPAPESQDAKDHAKTATIGGVSFEAVKVENPSPHWRAKVAGGNLLPLTAATKGELWQKLKAHHASVGDAAFAAEFAPAAKSAKHGGGATGNLSAQQLQNLQSIPWFKQMLPDSNTNAKSHNAAVAKIKAMAFAGDTAGLQAFIDAKSGAKQTYAKKQVLLAQTALAGLQAPGSTAAVPVEPQPQIPPPVTADDLAAVAKMKAEKVAKTKAALEAKGYGYQEHPIKGLLFAPHKGGMAWSTTFEEVAQQKAQELEQQGLDVSIIGDSPYLIKVHGTTTATGSQPPKETASPPAKVKVDAQLLENTEPGHNKFWAISVFGTTVKTHYGKIGTKGKETVKEYPSEAAAKNAAVKLMQQKKAKGYVYKGLVKHEYDAPSGTVEQGPKEGDIKQGADVLLVFKNGRWHKAQQGDAPKQFKKLTKEQIAAVIGKITPGQSSFLSNKFGKGALKAALKGHGELMHSYWTGAISNGGYPKTAAHIKAVAEAMGVDTSSWGAQQDAKPSSAATDPSVASKPSAPVLSAGTSKKINDAVPVRSMNGWTQVGGQKGSNEGALYQDKNGQKWYCKFPADQDVVLNEFLANRFYVMLGLKAPELRLVEKGGKLGIASKWIDGLTKGSAEELAKAPGAKEGFVVDAWLANWDVVGLNNDNLMLDASGRAVRVDAGGSLLYRAQGGLKGDAFGSEVAELETLLDAAKNQKSAAVFGGITDQELREGARKLAKLKPSQIRELVGKAGPTDPAVRSQLASTLIARRAYILDKLGVDDPWSSKPVDTKRLDVSGVEFPSPLNFSNWGGTGKGLSSKEHVNEQNSKDSAALVAFAKLGNLDALKDYHYDAVDKQTGKVIGKKPITEHPSKHIKEQWAGLIELLQSIAFPHKDTLSMPDLGEFDGSLGEIAESAKPFDPKQTVESVPAEHRMGFFMVIGQASEEAAKEALNSTPWFWAKKSDLDAKLKNGYSKLSTLVKKFVSAVQSSGWVNHVWSKGDKNVLGHNVTELAAEIYKHAYEVEEGLQMWRWMNDTTAGKSMSKALLNAKPGMILQNTNSMCTSYAEHWGDQPRFGSDVLMRIRCAKGVKVIPSAGSGKFSNEHELTTLPGQRFLVVGVKKGVPGNDSGVLLDVIALPPDQGYVAQLNDPAYYKSVLMFFGGSSEWLTPALSKRSSAKGTSSIRLTRATLAIPTSSIA